MDELLVERLAGSDVELKGQVVDSVTLLSTPLLTLPVLRLTRTPVVVDVSPDDELIDDKAEDVEVVDSTLLLLLLLVVLSV